MAFNLSTIRRGVVHTPPRVVVYGPHGVGKTTFAACAPSPILMQTEDGEGIIDVPRWGLLRTYADIMEAFGTLINERHEFATAAIDTMDWLEPIVHAETCARNKWSDIEAPGFGKGYLAADDVWREVFAGLDAMRAKGMAVILLAHSEVKQFNDPVNDPFDRYQIKLQKRGASLMQEWADAVLFATYKTYTEKTDAGFRKTVTKGKGHGERVLYTEERPAFYAKNRYGLPPEIELSYQAFSQAMYPQPQVEPANQ